jgi:hypothetical protein
MFDQLLAEILASLIKGFPRTTTRTRTTTTKQNVDPAVHFVYSRVKMKERLFSVSVQCAASPWQAPGKPLASPWQAPGKPPASPRQAPGQPLVSPRPGN